MSSLLCSQNESKLATAKSSDRRQKTRCVSLATAQIFLRTRALIRPQLHTDEKAATAAAAAERGESRKILLCARLPSLPMLLLPGCFRRFALTRSLFFSSFSPPYSPHAAWPRVCALNFMLIFSGFLSQHSSKVFLLLKYN